MKIFEIMASPSEGRAVATGSEIKISRWSGLLKSKSVLELRVELGTAVQARDLEAMDFLDRLRSDQKRGVESSIGNDRQKLLDLYPQNPLIEKNAAHEFDKRAARIRSDHPDLYGYLKDEDQGAFRLVHEKNWVVLKKMLDNYVDPAFLRTVGYFAGELGASADPGFQSVVRASLSKPMAQINQVIPLLQDERVIAEFSKDLVEKSIGAKKNQLHAYLSLYLDNPRWADDSKIGEEITRMISVAGSDSFRGEDAERIANRISKSYIRAEPGSPARQLALNAMENMASIRSKIGHQLRAFVMNVLSREPTDAHFDWLYSMLMLHPRELTLNVPSVHRLLELVTQNPKVLEKQIRFLEVGLDMIENRDGAELIFLKYAAANYAGLNEASKAKFKATMLKNRDEYFNLKALEILMSRAPEDVGFEIFGERLKKPSPGFKEIYWRVAARLGKLKKPDRWIHALAQVKDPPPLPDSKLFYLNTDGIRVLTELKHSVPNPTIVEERVEKMKAGAEASAPHADKLERATLVAETDSANLDQILNAADVMARKHSYYADWSEEHSRLLIKIEANFDQISEALEKRNGLGEIYLWILLKGSSPNKHKTLDIIQKGVNFRVLNSIVAGYLFGTTDQDRNETVVKGLAAALRDAHAKREQPSFIHFSDYSDLDVMKLCVAEHFLKYTNSKNLAFQKIFAMDLPYSRAIADELHKFLINLSSRDRNNSSEFIKQCVDYVAKEPGWQDRHRDSLRGRAIRLHRSVAAAYKSVLPCGEGLIIFGHN